jgi:hypothetical protein
LVAICHDPKTNSFLSIAEAISVFTSWLTIFRAQGTFDGVSAAEDRRYPFIGI